ncbi:MAG TPA: ABC transporter ATP-binding protein, partial [Opitutaceae bacterium]|nr:ABC transporter ATP-binding protein [Opitutaceae bacterium]
KGTGRGWEDWCRILDDALSAVDGETETLILDALRRRRGRSTTLVIAHRLSTLIHADRVIVMDKGRIIQTGTHAELSQTEGLYRRLWQIQSTVEAEFQRELLAQ